MGTFECDTSQNSRWVCPATNGAFISDQCGSVERGAGRTGSRQPGDK